VEPYVLFSMGVELRGREAIRYFEARGIGPPPVATVTVPMFEQHDGMIAVEAEYEYESLRLVEVRWRNASAEEPAWSFGGTVVRLSRGAGSVPVPPLVCREADGQVQLPFTTVETVPDGG
jgi:hypothetical protein